MTAIAKGDMQVGNASGSFGILNAPANGKYWVADSSQPLGYVSENAPPALNSGNATLASGTAVVSNSLVTANSIILLTANSTGILGSLSVPSKTAGTGFTINSSLITDAGTVGYLIIG